MERQTGSVQELAEKVKVNPELEEMLKRDPAGALEALAVPAHIPDTFVYRITVGSLGAAVLVTLIGAIVLVALGKETPEILVAIGSAAVGALAGLLAPSPARN
ncbi:MAG: hypothetical protein ACE5G0_21600 [Rhodothermales bacterium]